MSQQLLWVHKSAQSKRLSQSSRSEETKIRRHVQSVKSGLRSNEKSDEEHLPQQKSALKHALRPNRAFSRAVVLGASRGKTVHKQDGDSLVITQPVNPVWIHLDPSARRSLAFFESCTSQNCAGWEDAPFWNTLVLQVAQRSQTIVYGLSALSAIHESMSSVTTPQMVLLRESSDRSSRLVAQSIASTSPQLFEALISCIIMLVVQSLQHSRHAFRLLRSGNALLEECMSATGRAISGEEARIIETQLRPLLGRLKMRACRMGEPAAAFALSVKRERCKLNDSACDGRRLFIPPCFDSLRQARDHLQEMLDWAHDCIACPSLSEQCSLDNFERLHDQWTKALAVSFSGPLASKDCRSMTLLQISSLFGAMLVSMFPVQQETMYDQHICDFDKIVDLAEQVMLQNLARDVSFGIDDGLVDMLAFVGHKCRDPTIRRRAVNLLRDGNRVEGDRIASIPAAILEVHMQLEERGRQISSCMDIAETDRWRVLRGHQYFGKGRVKLFFVGYPYDTNSGAPIEERYVDLPGPREGESRSDNDWSKPDAVFGPGYAAFLDNQEQGLYYQVEAERFVFPIPRV